MGKGCTGNVVKKTKMKFILTISFLFSIAFAQIKADGKTDDLAALQEWVKAGGGVISLIKK